jgi:hypothetical protein
MVSATPTWSRRCSFISRATAHLARAPPRPRRGSPGAGDRAAHLDAGGVRRGDHRREALDALGDRAVDVLLAEGFAGGAEHHDLVRPGRPARPPALQVGRQHRVAHAGRRRMPAITSALSAICGTHFGLTKLVTSISRSRPPAGAASARSCARWDRLLFVLQAVARADLDQGDAGAVGSWSLIPTVSFSSSPPSATWSPTAYSSSATTPSRGAADGVLHLHRLHHRQRLAAA